MFRLNTGLIPRGAFRCERLVAAVGFIACSAFGTTLDQTAAMSYGFSGVPSFASAGTNLSVTLNALTQSGELAAGYQGQAYVSSSDPLADVPSGPTGFMAGVCDLQVTLRTAGEQTVTATELANPSLFGTATI